MTSNREITTCKDLKTIDTKPRIDSTNMYELMLLLSGGVENAKVNEMITSAKRDYVNTRHTRAISNMTNAKGYKKGKWKTYVGDSRKEVIKATEQEIYEYLFNYYIAEDNRIQTLEGVFTLYKDYKETCLGRKRCTVQEDERYFRYIDEALRQKRISDITDEDIQRWLIKSFLPRKPRESALRRMLQLWGQVFQYGIRKKLCFDNPMKYVHMNDYLSMCDLNQKSNENKEFSLEELTKIKQDALADGRPRALMALMAMETGLRAGELAALHKSDISNGYIHVHRQQIRDNSEDTGKQFFYEVPYTKDERLHPHDGRYIPITKECEAVLCLVYRIPGDSEYLFHEPNKPDMISKDSYEQNLRKRCQRLGTLPKNNHAFRIAFNSRLIEQGFSAADRALILGHEVQTNENHYSLTDKRRLEDIKQRLT